ncbi:adaptin domain protein, partial [Cooperia oncophora]
NRTIKGFKITNIQDNGSGTLVDFSQPGNEGSGNLVDVFGHSSSGRHQEQAPSNMVGTGEEMDIANKHDYLKFVVKNNGVLYEDEVIQIGCKLEARTNLARLGMFYGNKTTHPFTDFIPTVSCPGVLAMQLQAQAKPMDPIVQAGTQVQQLINFVCVQEFGRMPIMQIKFGYTDRTGQSHSFDKSVYLPVFVNKF